MRGGWYCQLRRGHAGPCEAPGEASVPVAGPEVPVAGPELSVAGIVSPGGAGEAVVALEDEVKALRAAIPEMLGLRLLNAEDGVRDHGRRLESLEVEVIPAVRGGVLEVRIDGALVKDRVIALEAKERSLEAGLNGLESSVDVVVDANRTLEERLRKHVFEQVHGAGTAILERVEALERDPCYSLTMDRNDRIEALEKRLDARELLPKEQNARLGKLEQRVRILAGHVGLGGQWLELNVNTGESKVVSVPADARQLEVATAAGLEAVEKGLLQRIAAAHDLIAGLSSRSTLQATEQDEQYAMLRAVEGRLAKLERAQKVDEVVASALNAGLEADPGGCTAAVEGAPRGLFTRTCHCGVALVNPSWAELERWEDVHSTCKPRGPLVTAIEDPDPRVKRDEFLRRVREGAETLRRVKEPPTRCEEAYRREFRAPYDGSEVAGPGKVEAPVDVEPGVEQALTSGGILARCPRCSCGVWVRLG